MPGFSSCGNRKVYPLRTTVPEGDVLQFLALVFIVVTTALLALRLGHYTIVLIPLCNVIRFYDKGYVATSLTIVLSA